MTTILLTGFPGLLGTKLVARLLARYPSDVTITCLIQTAYRAMAEGRAREIEQQETGYSNRIRLVEGDIRQPDLGLGASYAGLGAETAVIFHLAAVYDLSVKRDFSMAVNVDGTRHMLDFARQCANLNRFQYVSTCYVSGNYPGVFAENELQKGQRFNNYYEETKYLAEVAVQEQMRQGLPTTIYRPSSVVGDSQNGATQKYDGLYYVLQWLLRQPRSAAVLPVIGDPTQFLVNFVPRDFVIDALSYLSGLEASEGKVYQLSDPNPPRVDETIDMIGRAMERRIMCVRLPAWLAKGAMEHIPGVASFMRIEPAAMDYFTQATQYTCDNTLADLEGSGIQCPPLAGYIDNLVAFMKTHPKISAKAMV